MTNNKKISYKNKKSKEKMIQNNDIDKLVTDVIFLPKIPDFFGFTEKSRTIELADEGGLVKKSDKRKVIIQEGRKLKKAEEVYTMQIPLNAEYGLKTGKWSRESNSIQIRDVKTGEFREPAKLKSVVLNQALATAVGQYQLQIIAEKLDDIGQKLDSLRGSIEIKRVAKLRTIEQLLHDKKFEELKEYIHKNKLQDLTNEFEGEIRKRLEPIKLKNYIKQPATVEGIRDAIFPLPRRNQYHYEKNIQKKTGEWLNEIESYLLLHNHSTALLGNLYLIESGHDSFVKLVERTKEFYSESFQSISEEISSLRASKTKNKNVKNSVKIYYRRQKKLDKSLESSFDRLVEYSESVQNPGCFEIKLCQLEEVNEEEIRHLDSEETVDG